ncbi:MAG: 30S ribosomal protein S4 [Candidatus Nealsonbacteria bacterium]|nr:MAG: 30S ribosomal protein S4 [Candidatus Nealsonbacteria bacterium]
MKKNVCKICRRLGQKLFLKGEKCSSPKCPMVKKPYPPGLQRKRRRSILLSEYGKELNEKQKLKNYYGLRENQFKRYVEEILKARGKVEDAGILLIKKLEKRLDNVVFRLGFARSRREARELVSHGHFLVDSKPVNIPSFQVEKGQVISVKESKKKKPYFKNLSVFLKNYQPPAWLKLDSQKLEGKIIEEPTGEDIGVPLDVSAIFEFYSR